VVGANPEAARVAGLDVDRTRLTTMLWSGALCGLAGAVELSGVVGTLYENYAPGYGFAAIAVALLGRLSPYGVVASAGFFGALAAGSGSMERTAGVSANLSYVLQAGTLLVLLGSQWVRWERRLRADAPADTTTEAAHVSPPA
jgi:simple sugar transport system permease protein